MRPLHSLLPERSTPSRLWLAWLVGGTLACVAAFSPIRAAEAGVRRENIEWTNLWIPDANRRDLPRVLLIGDSICNAYRSTVEQELRGVAYVAMLATSSAIQDPALADQIRLLLRNYDFAVIHFNNGLHGFDYTEADYHRDFPKLLKVIRRGAPKAKLIWATSTPMRNGKNLQEFDRNNDRVKARNRIVTRLAAERGIPVNDLYRAVESHPEFWSNDGVHFKSEGQTSEGKQVAECVRRALSERR